MRAKSRLIRKFPFVAPCLAAAAKHIADRTLCFFKGALDNYKDEIEFFGSLPTMYAGLVDPKGKLQLYDGGPSLPRR